MSWDEACRQGSNLTVGKLITWVVLLTGAVALAACEAVDAGDPPSLLIPTVMRSELVGLVAGFGTTFAAMPDLIAMLRRRSSAGMNPRMAAITGLFQIVWVYYGVLIVSRPVVAWNTVGVLINLVSVGAFFYFSPDRHSPRSGNARA